MLWNQSSAEYLWSLGSSVKGCCSSLLLLERSEEIKDGGFDAAALEAADVSSSAVVGVLAPSMLLEFVSPSRVSGATRTDPVAVALSPCSSRFCPVTVLFKGKVVVTSVLIVVVVEKGKRRLYVTRACCDCRLESFNATNPFTPHEPGNKYSIHAVNLHEATDHILIRIVHSQDKYDHDDDASAVYWPFLSAQYGSYLGVLP